MDFKLASVDDKAKSQVEMAIENFRILEPETKSYHDLLLLTFGYRRPLVLN